MSEHVPTPVAAALGLVTTVLDGARRLPGKAVMFPVLAVSSALAALDTARREYDELAGRGERLVTRLRGTSLDGFEHRVEDVWHGTPLATPYDKVEDAVEDAVGQVSDLPDKARRQPPAAGSAEVVKVGAAVDDALPLPDYDRMTLGSLRGRLRSLTVTQLGQIRDYEKAHADRLPVVTLLENRLTKLATDKASHGHLR